MESLESHFKTKKMIKGLIITVVLYIILGFVLIANVNDDLKFHFWILEGMLFVFLIVLAFVVPMFLNEEQSRESQDAPVSQEKIKAE